MSKTPRQRLDQVRRMMRKVKHERDELWRREVSGLLARKRDLEARYEALWLEEMRIKAGRYGKVNPVRHMKRVLQPKERPSP